MASERERILKRYRGAIIGGMARTLWVHAYVAWAGEDEENDPDGVAEAMSGVDWADLAPDTPPAALDAANALAELYETGTDQGDIVDLYGFAIHADTGSELEMDDLIGAGRNEPLPGEFGAALANMALSTGSSWFDDHKKFVLARPSFECHYDGVQLTWSGKSDTLLRSGVEVPDLNAHGGRNGLRVKVSYELITPESAEEGDVAERGWDNEEGELMENVREAVEWLTEHGPLEPSSSSFHHGIWYTHYGEADWQTGEVRNESFHVTGATVSQEQRIFDGLAKAHVLRGHYAGRARPRSGTRPNPSRAELRDVGFVQSTLRESIDSEFKQKVASIDLKPGPTGKVPTEDQFKRDLAANLTMGVMLDDEGEECGCEHKNPPGRFTDKGERMYQDVKLEYERKGNPRAAELAARTVYAEAKKGVPGLLNVGAGRPPGVPNPGRFRRL